MEAFSDIYILDLHGSSKKREKSPDGSQDENVFDIQQGVAISIFIKRNDSKQEEANVWYAQQYGLREFKYQWLSENSVESSTWVKVVPQEPSFFFVPQIGMNIAEYKDGRQLTHIFQTASSGFQTKRDSFTIHEKEVDLSRVLADLLTLPIGDIRSKYDLPPDGRDWTISWAKEHIKRLHTSNHLQSTTCLYRPFDLRETIFDNKSKGFLAYPRYEVLSNMLKPNIALITTRQLSGNHFRHIFVTRHIIDGNTISLQTHEYNYLFPLYLYQEHNKQGLFGANETSDAPGGCCPNLTSTFITDISRKLNMQFIQDGKGNLLHTFGPEDIFNYMYAVLHSPTYRSRYAEFLKIDYPCIPLPTKVNLFRALCAIGYRLVGLHLMEKYGQHRPNYPELGTNIVEKVDYTQLTNNQEQGRVWINKTQYFDRVPAEVWDFYIGGFQVCQKWLKDRKGRQLDMQDVIHYERIVGALAETITLMEQIDEAIDEHGGWPIV